MATRLSTAATKAAASPVTKYEASEYKGNVYVAYDEYVLDGTVIGGSDTVRFMKLPNLARVTEVAISYPDLGTTGTGTLGWEANSVDSADADGFMTALDFKTAADTILMSSEANVPGFGKQFSAQTQVTLTMTEATTATTGTIKLAVTYVMD
jgi:hypothetical protein